jgi:hypothetical protein
MPTATDLPTVLRTYRAVCPQGGVVERHGGCWVVRTPANPSWFWGNFLQFDAAPSAADAERWPALFTRHLGAPGHVALGWETDEAGDAAAIAAFHARGYESQESLVMVADTVSPAPPPGLPATLRPLASQTEWDALVEFNVATRDEGFPEAGYRRYSVARVAQWRRQCEAGLGVWVGAFVAGELASTLGLFAESEPGADGLRLARYQEVTTAAKWRHQGLCSALLPFAAAQLAPLAVQRHVIVADEHDLARHVYAARGFRVQARWRGLLLADASA